MKGQAGGLQQVRAVIDSLELLCFGTSCEQLSPHC